MRPSAEVVQDAFGFTGSISIQHRLGNVPMLFFVDANTDEIRRRDAAGVGAIVDRGVINALWELPDGIDFPRSALPDWVLERLKTQIPRDASNTIRRDLRPPLTIHAAAGTGPSLSRILDAVGQLSSVCATAAVVTARPPTPDDPALLDAQLFGVGVGAVDGHRVHVLNHAQPMRPDLGAYQWHVAELLYSEIVGVS